ncbi:MAG: Cupin domain protein [Methanomassiliicoccales archaeon PtaU1.Bin124]|nr:MAG: Cupin domain protein [Methanomassiliicoccales archaeon PtaU1.Bin124]
MKVTRLLDLEDRKNPHGVTVKTVYDHDSAQAVHITLEPGQELKRHVTPVDVFFYILEGKGQVEIGDEVREVDKDTVVDSPANIPHRLMNPFRETMRFLVVKAPRPDAKSKLL